MSTVLSPPFRISYPKVFKPEVNKLNKKEEFSCVALFKKGEDLAVLKNAVVEELEKKLGKDKKKWPTTMRTPFRDQGEKAKVDDATGATVYPAGHEPGAIFMNLRTTRKPTVLKGDKSVMTDESELYGGCIVRAILNPYYYDNTGNKGVSFGLVHLQKVADGEPFGGDRVKAEDAFTPIEGAVDASAASATSLFT